MDIDKAAAIVVLVTMALLILGLNIWYYRRRARLSGAEREKEDDELGRELDRW